MDIEVNTLAQIKAETGRDLDNQVDENTLVSGEKSNGTFGVFKLFAAIKNCIDNWITTIAGNKNFTGAVTINSKAVATTEAVNNALAKYPNCTYYNTVQTQSLNCNNIEDRVCLVTANINEYSSLNYPSKELLFIMTTKNSGGDGFQKAISYNTNKEWNRTLVNGNWGGWYEIATSTNCIISKTYNSLSQYEGQNIPELFRRFIGADTFTPVILRITAFEPSTMKYVEYFYSYTNTESYGIVMKNNYVATLGIYNGYGYIGYDGFDPDVDHITKVELISIG